MINVTGNELLAPLELVPIVQQIIQLILILDEQLKTNFPSIIHFHCLRFPYLLLFSMVI